jgi:ABC-type nitrate/sulfonate/bicarbonate transport system substrate-binding protein
MRTSSPIVATMAIVAIGLTTVACGSGSGATSDTVLDVATQDKYANLPLMVAYDQGYLEPLGITGVNLTAFTSVPALMTAVAKGQVDAGMQTVPVLTAHNRTSNDSVRFFDTAGQDITYWVVGSNSGLPTATGDDWRSAVAAWKGRDIGIPALGGSMEKALRYMLTEAGLNPDADVTIVPVGIGAAGVAALQQGLVDVLGGSSSTPAQTEMQGLGNVAVGGALGPELLRQTYTGGWFVSDSRADSDPAYYRDLTGAIEQARQFILDPANKDDVVRVITESVGVESAIAEGMYELDREGIGNAELTNALMEKTIQAQVEIGAIEAPAPTVEELVNADLHS